MSSFNENIDDERISFIKNYPIPNNKEDIIEFLLLASSNISLSDYDNGYNSIFYSDNIVNNYLPDIKNIIDEKEMEDEIKALLK